MIKNFYCGEPGGQVQVVYTDGKRKHVRPLRHVVLHSPSGFSWGYEGSGPADLALSILCDVLKEHPSKKQIYQGVFKAYAQHQEFKREFVARWDMHSSFRIDADTVADWLRSRGVEF